MEEDKDFIHWYRKSMEEFKPIPPLDSWDEINKQLDIDEVWENLHLNLDYADTKEKYFNYATYAERVVIIATLLLLIVPVLNQKYFTSPGFKTNSTSAYIGNDSIAPKSLSPEPDDVNQAQDKEDGTYNLEHRVPGSRKLSSNEPGKNNRVSFAPSKQDNPPVSGDLNIHNNRLSGSPNFNGEQNELRLGLARLNSCDLDLVVSKYAVGIDGVNVKKLEIALTGSNTEENPTAHTPPYKISFGIHGAIKNHWLLNQTTYRGLSSEELNTTLPSFGKSLGVSSTYNLASKVAVQAELGYAEEGQRYKDYINGKYTKKSIDLSYIHLATIFKYRLSPFLAIPGSSNSSLLLGFYNGRLIHAQEKVGSYSRSVTNEYKSHNTGFLAGFEFERAISKSMLVTSGIRFNYGLTNIYTGNGRVPASLNATRNGSVDLHISLHFFSPRK